MNLAEQILSGLVGALKDLYPNIEVENTKNKLSTVLSEYYIQRVGEARFILILRVKYNCSFQQKDLKA